MGKKIIFVILMMFISGCSMAKDPWEENKMEGQEKAPVQEVELIKEKLKTMTLEEKVGQMFMVGFEGSEESLEIKDLIQNKHVGGVVFFDRNIKDSENLLNLMNSLREFNKNNKFPLFMSLDEEGGRVSRLPKEIKKFPSSMSIGKLNNDNVALNVGKVTGEKLTAFGFNMNFAPVLDIYSNPKNKVIGDRAFGSDPNIVKTLGIANMKGLSSEGVIPVIKHFPGHGDTLEDSHLKLPIVYNDYERLNGFELIPFVHAIENGSDAVMVAHILLNKIDSVYPASLSRNIITDILRNKLHFNGVVITDDMEMNAILEKYKIEDAALKSVEAGSDIILICKNYDNSIKAINKIILAAKDNQILQQRIDESVYRILRLKDKYKLEDRKIADINIKLINEKMDSVLDKIK